MNIKQWKLFNNGPSPAEIRKKKLVDVGRRGLVPIVERLMGIRKEEYILIPHNQMIFPTWDEYGAYEMQGREFKKRGQQFNLKTKTGEDRIKERIGPQKLMLSEMEKVFSQEKFSEDIIRRGLKWDKATTKANHTIMPQRDLMAGWRLASLSIIYGLNLKYSNPGNIFFIEVPSRKGDPSKNRYNIKIYNFATTLPSGYADWPNLDGRVSAIEDEAEKAFKGVDMYSEASLRYKIQELRLNFQLAAAAILRNHYTDRRYSQGKFRNRKRVEGQPIEPVLLNVTMPPTALMIDFDNKLQNNILIGEKGEYPDGKKKKPRKLNAGEREPFYCVFEYLTGVRNCYRHDEELQSLDQVVAEQKAVLGVK